MCGIVCVLSRPSTRPVPAMSELFADLDAASGALSGGDVGRAGALVSAVDARLRGEAGLTALVDAAARTGELLARLDAVESLAVGLEERVEAEPAGAAEMERRAGEVGVLRDALWSLRHDRLRTASLVGELAGGGATSSALSAYLSIQQALSALDLMEVRGRDSAGLHVFVSGAAAADDDPRIAGMLASRRPDPLFTSGSVRVGGGQRAWSFVYKAAAEIGELGDNTAAMRRAIVADDLLRFLVSQSSARVSVIGHTRWASVGIISEPNAHPVNSEETNGSAGSPYFVSVLNGDVDNHAEIKANNELMIADPITTDAKVIPTVVSRRVSEGAELAEAFRRTVDDFDGSVAIATLGADEPDTLLLALRGSGQGLFIGLAEDRFIVASEPYGLVEETSRYVRMDGDVPCDPDNPSSRGQIAILRAAHAGEPGGIRLTSYEGTPIPLGESDVVVAEVTTRDIDRGDHRHFLSKEIAESPQSVRKTIRGRIVDVGGAPRVHLEESEFPAAVRDRLAGGHIRRVRVIGQGTAAVAGQSAARMISSLSGPALDVDSVVASELSGFQLEMDMSDVLIVAVSQSGTTTDTNRTVDLARARGAAVIAVVNRRGSDLTTKADGVVYTSDGRDVEMSVASTKAFYSQVVAGALLGCAIAEAVGSTRADERARLLAALRELPMAMTETLGLRPKIAEAARRHATSRRYWTVVGNGPNVVAAEEIRIKLSELCYKSIARDVTEDKKHIDLSCEPLILVCATGLGEGTVSDVAKEVDIYGAHKALPIVVTERGGPAFASAAAVIHVPTVEPSIAFVLAVMVGHLFGYEAALAIDSLARPLREMREVIEHAVERGADGSTTLAMVRDGITRMTPGFLAGLGSRVYDGNLEASTAVGVVGMLRVLAAPDPLVTYQDSTGRVASPEAVLDDLTTALTRAIDELTRPVDAIKHQAKTVTVGISRSDEGLLDRPLVQALFGAGASRDAISYRALKVVASLDPAVKSVLGYTRYRVEGEVASGSATLAIVDRGGIARELPSRVDASSALRGTKHRVAVDGTVLVARGGRDGRTVVLVPETKGPTTTGITLLHVAFHDRMPAAVARGVLQGYDNRYDRLVDWVSETDGDFREDRLAEVSVESLLIDPISETARHWLEGHR